MYIVVPVPLVLSTLYPIFFRICGRLQLAASSLPDPPSYVGEGSRGLQARESPNNFVEALLSKKQLVARIHKGQPLPYPAVSTYSRIGMLITTESMNYFSEGIQGAESKRIPPKSKNQLVARVHKGQLVSHLCRSRGRDQAIGLFLVNYFTVQEFRCPKIAMRICACAKKINSISPPKVRACVDSCHGFGGRTIYWMNSGPLLHY